MKQVEDLCHSCNHFWRGDYECELKHYLDDSLTTVECEDYTQGEGWTPEWFKEIQK